MIVPDWLVLAGAVVTLSVQTLTLVIGMANFKRWLERTVIEPYIKPIREEMSDLKKEADADRKLLHDHDRHIYLLLGKVLGGMPDGQLSHSIDVHFGAKPDEQRLP